MIVNFSKKKLCKKNKLLCNIKMTDSIDVNLSRRWGEKKYVREG
jgi:hypothetical protein